MDPLLTVARRHWPLALGAYLAAWAVPGLISTSQLLLSYSVRGDEPSIGLVLGVALPGWYAWAALAPIVYLAARRMPLEGPGWWRVLPVHLVLNALLALVWVGLLVSARRAFGLPGQTDVRLQLISGVGTSLLTYWVIVLAAHALRYQQQSRMRALRAAELGARLSEARLTALQAQLHPHFLFNTMHAISAFVRDEPEKAETMLAGLADLLRLVLDTSDDPVVPLARELEFVDRYLSIQGIRLGDRLRTEVTLSGDPSSARVPALLLQPLVENAVEHGVARRKGAGRVDVAVKVASGRVSVTVRDDGPGLPPEKLDPGQWRVGLRNTRERLTRLYGSDHRFEFSNAADGGLCIHIDMPATLAGEGSP